jgi:tetratricopeptide (TPR) repeat protein
MSTVRSEADLALGIAREQQWSPMQVVIHMVLGSTFLSRGEFDTALASYREAGDAAATAEAEGDPSAPKLLLQTKLAEGSALFSAGRYAEAATLYEETSALAESQNDLLMTLECWRMAAYCNERLKRYEDAWRCGTTALGIGEQMEPDARRDSTLPYVGTGLLRLVTGFMNKSLASGVRERMNELLGPDWEELAANGTGGRL